MTLAAPLAHYTLNNKPCSSDFNLILPLCNQTGDVRMAQAPEKSDKPLAIVTLAPNPTRNEVTLTYGNIALASSVSLYDLSGRELGVFGLEGTSGTLVLTTQNYPSGIYLVVVYNKEGVVAQKKLIIN